ncbi:MAG: cytochrome c oxidase assembly protein [Verrucomicrobia bacterium]|nr:cytochrome c oxidase assembly protein [Verrucomicrobiota bacterium]
MSPAATDFLSGWTPGFWSTLGLGLALGVYLRGWRRLHRMLPERFPGWRAVAFAAGIFAVAVAEWSPLDAWAAFLLSAHMVQHLLLVLVAAPLLLLGAPFLPLLRGLPRPVARDALAPFLNAPELRRLGHRMTHPVTGWLALTGGMVVWHVPAAFDAALRSPFWHGVEHATFFLGALLFWWPVVRPFPSRPVWPLWTVPLYLLAADLVNSALAAVLTFSERVLYPTYAAAPRLFGSTALGDQSLAGILMWVPGSMVFLIPAVLTAIRWLSPEASLVVPGGVGKPSAARQSFRELPEVPDGRRGRRVGAFVARLGVRRSVQAVALALAAWVIVDGFFGAPDAASNAAGGLAWNGVRALALLGLLVVGNVFCFACPFMLPRELARRFGGGRRPWPRLLRGKWLAVALLMLFFWAYEAWDLWNRPAATAALVLGYFTACLAVDSVFQGASFCRYVCPIGQFTMVASLASPAEVTVQSPATCADCTTHDCLRGNPQTRARGCELGLWLPKKSGSLDCTFCLDCARACPHDNVTLEFRSPARSLVTDTVRSGVGRLSARWDVAALALVLVLAGVSGAAVMTAPVSEWISAGSDSGSSGRGLRTALFQWGAAGAIPAAVLGMALMLGRRWSGRPVSFRTLACRLILSTVPVGLALWTAHLTGHLMLAGAGELPGRWLPDVVRRGITGEGMAVALLAFQTLLLGLGWLLTLYAGWQIARDLAPPFRSALRLFLPWGVWTGAIYGVGLWCLVQPMPLRGVMNIPLP